MQLRKMTLMIAALGLALTACPGGRDDLSCTADTDCSGENEICHPTAQVCVQTCTDTNDCPDSSKTCEAISATNSQKICKCATDQQCQTDERVTDASTLSCVKSGSNYGVCKSTGTGGGTTPPGAACTGSGQSTCAYGQFCSSGTCTAAPEAAATCENFSKNRPDWSAASSNGPVIYSVAGTAYQKGSAYCGDASAPDAFIVRVRAYRTDADWPAARSGLSGFFYVTTGSNRIDVVNSGLLVPNTGYNRTASNPKDAEFNVYLCRPSNSQTIQVGFYFTGGNPVCENVNN
jgi:hypothetical protein